MHKKQIGNYGFAEIVVLASHYPINRTVAAAILLVLFCISSPCNATESKDISLDKSIIIVPPEKPICRNAAVRLQSFIEKTCGKAPKIDENANLGNESEQFTVIAIGTIDGFTGLDKFNVAADLTRLKHDGYVLKTTSAGNKNYIMALGISEKGAVNAIWRLLREVNNKNGGISVRQLAATESPFIKIREVVPYDPWIRDDLKSRPVSAKLMDKYFLHNWDANRLRNYIDLLDSLGYNSVELSDAWLMLAYFKNTPREQWRDKIRTMAMQAHRNGQDVNLFIYTSSVKDFITGREYTNPGACFNDPCELNVLLIEYDWQANSYGHYVDRIVTYWADYGGCRECKKGCTIKSALDYHNIITNKFREKNAAVKSAFSLWGMNELNYPGYKNIDSVLDAQILPNDVTMVQPVMLDTEQGRYMARKGYNFAVWSWDMLDIECTNGLIVKTKGIENYWRGYPSDVSHLIEWNSVDNGSSFLILSNLYVNAQLMWNPGKSGSELLREFTRGMFGTQNEEKMARILEAVESCYLMDTPMALIPPAYYSGFGSVKSCYSTDCENGSDPANCLYNFGCSKFTRKGYDNLLAMAPERLELIQRTRAALKKIKIASDFVPAFPLIIQPNELIEEIKVQLDIMSIHFEFQVGAAKLLKMKSRGESKDKIAKTFEALPEIPFPTEYLWTFTYVRYEKEKNILREYLEL